MKSGHQFCFGWIVCICFATALVGQDIRVDVQLRQVVATVTDAEGRLVTDLRPEDFIVNVDGIPQTVSHLVSGADSPVTLGLLLDTSCSVWSTLPSAVEAVKTFIHSMRPRDEAFLMTFADDTDVRQDLTRESTSLLRAVDTIRSTDGGTRLVSALVTAIEKTRQGSNRKRALIVVSDGGEKVVNSRLDKLRSRLNSSETLIYTVQTPYTENVLKPPRPASIRPNGTSTRSQREAKVEAARKSTQPEYMKPDELAKFRAAIDEMNRWSAALMKAIAESSGGRHFSLDVQSPVDVFAAISAELRGQYTLGFYPGPKLKDGKVSIRTVNPAYRVRS